VSLPQMAETNTPRPMDWDRGVQSLLSLVITPFGQIPRQERYEQLGLIWAIDAYFKWRPAFFNNSLSYITDIVSGQPTWLLPWFNF
jgi:hypothetical protein